MHWVEKCQVTIFKTAEQKGKKHVIWDNNNETCRNYSKIPNMPLKYIWESAQKRDVDYLWYFCLSAFAVGKFWGCCKTCCFWLFSNSLVVRVSVQMPNFICITSAGIGWPWGELASTSVSCCQPWRSADDLTFAWAGNLNVGFHIGAPCLGSDTPSGALGPAVLKDFSA